LLVKYYKESRIIGLYVFGGIKLRTFNSKCRVVLPLFLALLLFVSVFAVCVSVVAAQESVMNIASNAYVTTSPNPVGVNQPVTIMFWLDNTPPQIDSAHYFGWNYTLSIIKPDGTKQTVGPFESDAVGGSYYVFYPSSVGTYLIQSSFLGGFINVTTTMSLPRGAYQFQPSVSRVLSLVVQQEQVASVSEVPLPKGYWSYPISAENRDWYVLAGNWIGAGSPAYFTKAPSTSHIIWTKQLTFGGIAGEAGWGINWYTGLLYENKFNPKIISGRLYYNMWTGPGMFAAGVPSGVICVDMETGEEIWSNDSMPQITAAQILTFNSGFQAGTTAYLWTVTGTSWMMYDAFTGRLLTTFANASGGLSPVFGPNGEFLVYSLSGATNRLTMWNSTKAVIPVDPREGAATYKPWTSAVRSWADGIQLNVSVPDVPGSQSIQLTDYANGVIVAQSTITGFGLTPTFVHVGYDTVTGAELWRKNWTNIGWGAGGPTGPGLLTFTQAKGEGLYAFFEKETMRWHVINIKTGQEKWVTSPLNQFTNTDWSVYDWSAQIAYGKLIVDGYSGCVIAFDLATGAHLWTFNQGSSGYETPYGTWPSFGGVTVADNKVYFGVTEHTPNTPMLRGYNLYCIDVTTGKLLWKMPSFFTSIAIAGGKMVGYAGYDNQIYCYDKGLSAVAVSATAGVGNAVTIQGTVTDQSPGQTAVGVPEAGTPAIADESMDAWMQYLYMQQPMPSNATGVPVKVTVANQNCEVVYTAQTTSDASGHFIVSWTPAVSGTYTITADFEGSKSYYASSGTTGIAVGNLVQAQVSATPAPTSTPTMTAVPSLTPIATPTVTPSALPNTGQTGNTQIYLVGAAIVVIVAVAIVGLLLRRRK
jgi:LPXTG-motif cell wall-anchored protein